MSEHHQPRYASRLLVNGLVKIGRQVGSELFLLTGNTHYIKHSFTYTLLLQCRARIDKAISFKMVDRYDIVNYQPQTISCPL